MKSFKDIREDLKKKSFSGNCGGYAAQDILTSLLDVLDPPPPDWANVKVGTRLKGIGNGSVYTQIYYLGPCLHNNNWITVYNVQAQLPIFFSKVNAELTGQMWNE